jgi:hypothetical protein
MKENNDLPQLGKDPTPQEAAELLNRVVESQNFLKKNFSVRDNFNGQIIENIELTAGEEKVIPHNLGIVPPFRVILRQEGNGVISDIPSGWNKYSIKLKNNGAVTVTVTIWIVRE